ncbi:MAG: DNA internalization-related competence protein ComEC/Rec2, partial [Oceanococcaceae bacterium]
MARSGTSHLFAISGLHVGLIGLWAAWLGRGLWGWSGVLQQRIVRRRWLLLCAALAVGLYTAMAWEQISARRAGGMALAGMALLWAGRPFSPLSLLGLALVGILLLQPLAIFHPALSLSFGACVFLLLALPQLQARPWWQQWLLIQFLLGLGLAPVVVAWFGQWSLIGLGLNLLLVSAMVLLLPLVLLAEFLSLWGWSLPRMGMDAGLEGLFLLLEALCSPSWAVLYLPQGRWVWAISGCLGLAWALHRGGRQGLLIAALALPVCVVALRPLPSVPAGQARLSVLDVGQGQALIVETATQVAVLDTGPARDGGLDAGQMILLPHLRQRGWKAIDLLVLSHAHNDHSGGAAALAKALPIHQRWGHAGQSCDQARSWEADGVRIHSLARDYSRPWSENDRSCVLIVEAGAARLLVPGDVEAAAEAALSEIVGRHGPYAAALVAHHGSRSSSTEAWVQAVAAPLAIVSAGAYNRWGFPAPEVLQRWQQQGAEVLQTGEGGAVEILLPSMDWRR